MVDQEPITWLLVLEQRRSDPRDTGAMSDAMLFFFFYNAHFFSEPKVLKKECVSVTWENWHFKELTDKFILYPINWPVQVKNKYCCKFNFSKGVSLTAEHCGMGRDWSSYNFASGELKLPFLRTSYNDLLEFIRPLLTHTYLHVLETSLMNDVIG